MKTVLNGKYAPAGLPKHFGATYDNVPYLMAHMDGNWFIVPAPGEDAAAFAKQIASFNVPAPNKLYDEAATDGTWELVEAVASEVDQLKKDVACYEQQDLVEMFHELLDDKHISAQWIAEYVRRCNRRCNPTAEVS